MPAAFTAIRPVTPADGLIAVNRVDFDQACPAAGPFTGNQGCAASTKAIEHEIAASRAVQDGIGHEPDRFDGRVHREVRQAIRAEAVCPGIAPDVAAVSSVLSKLDIIGVFAPAIFPNED